MDKLDLQILIAGALVPFIISILKRWIALSKEQMAFVVLAFCFVIASVFELIENNFEWKNYLGNIATVYGVSQAVYWAVLKTTQLDVRIEGE